MRPPLGTPAAALGCAELSRRALGDISNAAGAAGGGGKLGATPARRALGDITNGGAAAAQCAPAPALKAGGKAALPAELAALPISERTAGFVTEEVLALARVYAAEGTEQLAGLSGRELQSCARAEEEAQAQAALEQLLAPRAWGAGQARPPLPPCPSLRLTPSQPSESYAPLDLGEADFLGEPQLEGPQKSALRTASCRVGASHP